MKSALKAVTGKEFSFRCLDEMTGHKAQQITYPSQIAAALADLKVDFLYFVKRGWKKKVAEFERSLADTYGEHASEIAAATNFVALKHSVERLEGNSKVVEQNSRPEILELEGFIKQGRIPICLVNHDVFRGRENCFHGHYLVLTGFEKDRLYFHNSGPNNAGQNLEMSRQKFLDSWSLCFFDHDLVVV